MTLFKTCSVLLVLFAACNGARHLSDTAGTVVTVNLGTAENYVIFAGTGITTVPSSAITGDIAVYPIKSTAMTGFTFTLTSDDRGEHATSAQVTGVAFASDYKTPTTVDATATLLTASDDMKKAYEEAEGRATTTSELEGGLLGGKTLLPGVHTFTTDVSVAGEALYLKGTATDIFVIQTTKNVNIATAMKVILVGADDQETIPLPKNIIWQVAGQVVVEANAHMEGTLLVKKAAVFKSNSSLNGRILAQTAVTLGMATITEA